MILRWKLLVSLLLAILLIIVAVQNTETVETTILFVTVAMPRAILILTALLTGLAAGLLIAFRAAKKKKD